MRRCLILKICVIFAFAIGCSAPKTIDQRIDLPTQTRLEIPGSGIALRSFRIVSDGDQLEETLQMFGREHDDAELQTRLAEEGIALCVVDSIDVLAIAGALGDPQEEQFNWHGQISNWRDVKQRLIPSDGMVITSRGVPYFVDHGYLTLLARGWQLSMEMGDQLYLQLLPIWHVPNEQGVVPGRGTAPVESRIFSELMIECILDDGQSLLLATVMKPEIEIFGPLDEGATGMRLGEALMGDSEEEPVVVFLVFEAHVGSGSDNW
ncbi:MAG: hypothetical protein QGI78_04540 [Phycisphaerales bacterium]|jgi:hypothetical protein|nr:hypothetical protein [Phycisphaerales bacterium]